MSEMLSIGLGGPLTFVLLLLVKSSLIVAAGFGLTRLLAKASAAVRHTAWAAVFAGLLLLPLLAGTMGWSLPILAPSGAESASVGAELANGLAPVLAREEGAADLASASSEAPGAAWMRAAIGVYFAGAALLLIRLALGLIYVAWLGRRSRRLTGERRWSEVLRSIAGGETPAELVLSSRLLVPMVWGWRRPVILLPAEAEQWNDRQLRDALVHELAHVQRGDWPIQIAVRLVCAMYWFHPLVWMARRRLVLEAERSCDDRVLAAGAERHGYAEHLVSLARFAAGLGAGGAVTMARRSQLSGRISALLDGTRRRGPVGLLAAAGLAVVALVPTLLVAPVHLVAASTAETPAEPSSAAEGEHDSTSQVDDSARSRFIGEPVTISLRDADLVETLRAFEEAAELDMVIQPGVDGKVTVHLVDVPWDQAFLQILEIQGLGFEVDDDVLRIAPISMIEEPGDADILRALVARGPDAGEAADGEDGEDGP